MAGTVSLLLAPLLKDTQSWHGSMSAGALLLIPTPLGVDGTDLLLLQTSALQDKSPQVLLPCKNFRPISA